MLQFCFEHLGDASWPFLSKIIRLEVISFVQEKAQSVELSLDVAGLQLNRR
jgi:hypothetical protein